MNWFGNEFLDTHHRSRRSESVRSNRYTEIEILHHQIGFFKISCRTDSTIGDVCNQIKQKYPDFIKDNLVLIKDGKILSDNDPLANIICQYLVCYMIDNTQQCLNEEEEYLNTLQPEKKKMYKQLKGMGYTYQKIKRAMPYANDINIAVELIDVL